MGVSTKAGFWSDTVLVDHPQAAEGTMFACITVTRGKNKLDKKCGMYSLCKVEGMKRLQPAMVGVTSLMARSWQKLYGGL